MKIFPWPQLILSSIHTLARYLFYIYGAILKRGPAREFTKMVSRRKLLITLFRIYLITLKNIKKIIEKRNAVMRSKKVEIEKVVNWLKIYKAGVKELTLFTWPSGIKPTEKLKVD